MRRTIELSERLAIGPAGLTRTAPHSMHTCLVTGVGYDSYHKHSYFTLDLTPAMRNEYTTERELRTAQAKGWILAAALIGLFGAACWFGWIGLTNL